MQIDKYGNHRGIIKEMKKIYHQLRQDQFYSNAFYASNT